MTMKCQRCMKNTGAGHHTVSIGAYADGYSNFKFIFLICLPCYAELDDDEVCLQWHDDIRSTYYDEVARSQGLLPKE